MVLAYHVRACIISNSGWQWKRFTASLSRHRESRALVASGYDFCRPTTCGASRRLNNMYRIWKVFPVVHTYILTTELALYCICIQTSSAKSSLTLGTHYSCSRAVFMGHGPCTRASFLDTRLSRSAAAIVNDVIIIFYLQDGCPKWHPCTRAVFTGREHG